LIPRRSKIAGSRMDARNNTTLMARIFLTTGGIFDKKEDR